MRARFARAYIDLLNDKITQLVSPGFLRAANKSNANTFFEDVIGSISDYLRPLIACVLYLDD